jgi:hypothetical protein
MPLVGIKLFGLGMPAAAKVSTTPSRQVPGVRLAGSPQAAPSGSGAVDQSADGISFLCSVSGGIRQIAAIATPSPRAVDATCSVLHLGNEWITPQPRPS